MLNDKNMHTEPPEKQSLLSDQTAATTLEWALLLAAIALPSYFAIKLSLQLLTDHYRMMTTLNGIPFP